MIILTVARLLLIKYRELIIQDTSFGWGDEFIIPVAASATGSSEYTSVLYSEPTRGLSAPTLPQTEYFAANPQPGSTQFIVPIDKPAPQQYFSVMHQNSELFGESTVDDTAMMYESPSHSLQPGMIPNPLYQGSIADINPPLVHNVLYVSQDANTNPIYYYSSGNPSDMHTNMVVFFVTDLTPVPRPSDGPEAC